MATSAPASAKPIANATPRPDDAPVTIATLPSREKRSRTLLIPSSLCGPRSHQQFARSLEAVARLELRQLALDLVPRLRALGLAQPRQHLVQRPERLAREAQVLGDRRQSQRRV